MAHKVPQKIIYAIMAILEIALHEGLPPVQAKVIARRQGIPVRFIEHILNTIKRAGLITSIRGPQGGYVLSRDPAELSLADIVQVMEDSPPSNRLDISSNGHMTLLGKNHQLPDALLNNIWEQVNTAKLAILGSITLKTLAERYRQLEQERAPMYHI